MHELRGVAQINNPTNTASNSRNNKSRVTLRDKRDNEIPFVWSFPENDVEKQRESGNPHEIRCLHGPLIVWRESGREFWKCACCHPPEADGEIGACQNLETGEVLIFDNH